MPMAGNTVQLVADIYNMSASATLTVTLEGSVLGQSWEDIPFGTAFAPPQWGGSTSESVSVTHAMVRVRAVLSGSTVNAWFDIGISFTDQ